MLDLQKASVWKRISAALFDFIMLGIAIVGAALLLSTLLGFDGYVEQKEALERKYMTEFGLETDRLYDQILEAYNSNIFQVVGDIYVNPPEVLDINALFIAIGLEPDNGVFKNAVKLDEKYNISGRFEAIIKPETLTSMNKVIEKLTGITNEMLDKGKDFKSAIDNFKEFCGNDFVILIWGFDDIRILKNNLAFHGLDASWLPKHYNLQLIFCHQTGIAKKQYSLSFAIEHFGISTDAQFHDAMNDAEYTALICQKLDLAKGIEALPLLPTKTQTGEEDSSMLIKRKFKNLKKKEDIWKNGFITRPECPYCSCKMTFEKPTAIGAFRYNIICHCMEHGDFMLVLRLAETPLKSFSVCQQIFILNDETKSMFEKKKKKSRHRFHRRRQSASLNSSQTTEQQLF